jgi:hypothetical protein
MGVQQRSVVKVLLLSIITFGLYWLYVTHKYHTEFAEEPELDSGFSPVVRTVMLFIPLVNFYALWLFYQDVETLTGESAVKYFALSFVFIGYYMAIGALNGKAA